jgi:hypothetical protein
MPYEPYLLLPLRRRDGTLAAHAIIDAADAQLARHKWHLRDGRYAVRSYQIARVKHNVYLHRAVLGLVPGDGLEGDHIDRNKLDCRRSNLRIVTHAQNQQNLSPRSNGSSRYRGVSWDRRSGRWYAYGHANGKMVNLGLFADELEAAEVASAHRREHQPFSNEPASAGR